MLVDAALVLPLLQARDRKLLRRRRLGALARDASPRRIHAALHAVAESEVVVDDGFANALLPHPRSNVAMIEPLTPRERQVLQFLAAGLTNKEIAAKVFLSVRTVEGLRMKMLEKMNAKNTAGIIIYAIKNNLYTAAVR